MTKFVSLSTVHITL